MVAGALAMRSFPSEDLGNAITSLILVVLHRIAMSRSRPTKKRKTYLKMIVKLAFLFTQLGSFHLLLVLPFGS